MFVAFTHPAPADVFSPPSDCWAMEIPRGVVSRARPYSAEGRLSRCAV